MRTFDTGAIEVHKRARLPHWSAEHAIYGVTMNLADAIPSHVRAKLNEEAQRRLAVITRTRGTPTHAETAAVRHWLAARLNRVLDEGHGACLLRDPRVAQLVGGAFEFFDSVRYELYAWCVMPNHAHVVFGSRPEYPRDSVLHSWKSFTSHEANKILARTGAFWQSDSFDRTIRNSQHLERAIAYVVNNPASAGLVEWPYVKTYPDKIAPLVSW